MPNWKKVIVSGSDAILNTLNLTSTPNSVGDILTIDSNGVIGKRTTGNILDDISAVPTSRTLTAGNGLTGGGNLTANRTFTLGTPSSITLSSTNSVTSTSHTHAFAPGGTTSQYIRGDGSLATFPTIGNGTLTLATSGIATGSQTFTANQTGGSTFTVNVPATNIAQGTRTATTVPITSSTGTNATLDIASTTLAGVMSAADKTKLNGIATGAQTGTVTSITAGDGLSGGTITTSGTIAVDGTVVRTSGNQTISGTKTFTGRLITQASGTSNFQTPSTGGMYLASELRFGNATSSNNFINNQYAPMIYGTRSGGAGGFGSSSLIIQAGGTLSDRDIYIRTNNQTRVFVANNGNVGIGNTSPSSKLEVTGNVAIGYTNAAPTNGMIVNGDVGIGTTSPNAKLDVSADILVNGIRVGRGAGNINTNTAVGGNALFSNTTGGQNTAVGLNALRDNTTGVQNTAVGQTTLNSNTTGAFNTAVGRSALRDNTTGNLNTAVGRNTLLLNTTGDSNVGLGFEAGRRISDGSDQTITNNSIFIGRDTRALADNQTNQIVIGHAAVGVGSNSVVLGNNSITKTILKGDVGIGTTTPVSKLEIVESSGATLRVTDSSTDFETTSTLILGRQGNARNCQFRSVARRAVSTNGRSRDLEIWTDNNGTLFHHSTFRFNGQFDTEGNIRVRTLATSSGDFVTADANGVFSRRTAAQVLDDISAVPTSRTITINSGGGLTGGAAQNLGANRTWNLAVDSTVVRTTGNQTIGGTKTFSSTIVGSINGNAATVGTFSETGFAVNQRGGNITTNAGIDNNNLRNGMYRVNSGVSSSPNSSRFWALNVYGNGSNVVSQLASDFQTGESYVRGYNTSWSSWRRVWDSVNLTNPVTGTGTTNFLSKFTGGTTLGNSQIFDNGTDVGIGTTSPNAKLDVSADILVNGITVGRGAGNLETNTALGLNALGKNTTGFSNTAVGREALVSNTTGTNNTALGLDALLSNTTGGSNTAVGQNALFNNTTGINNTAVGGNALLSNTTGGFNIAVGPQALLRNTTGDSNTALGLNAGRRISNGSNQTITNNSIFIGQDTRALADNQTNQIVIGHEAVGVGSNSVVLGNDSITKTILKGDVGIGTTNPSAKLHVNGDTRIDGTLLIGTQTNKATITYTTNTARTYTIPNAGTNASFVMTAGNQTIGGTKTFSTSSFITNSGANNSIRPNGLRLRSTSTARYSSLQPFQGGSNAFIGISFLTSNNANPVERMRLSPAGGLGLGVTTNNTAGRFEASNDIVAFASSDIRWKTNIVPLQSSLEKINKIQGVRFDWIEDEPVHGNKGHDIGVIAQEIEQILPEIVDTRDSGMKAVKYEKLIPLLIEGIKELSKEVTELKLKLNSK